MPSDKKDVPEGEEPVRTTRRLTRASSVQPSSPERPKKGGSKSDDVPAVQTPKRKGRPSLAAVPASPARVTRRSVAAALVEDEPPRSPARSKRRSIVQKSKTEDIAEQNETKVEKKKIVEKIEEEGSRPSSAEQSSKSDSEREDSTKTSSSPKIKTESSSSIKLVTTNQQTLQINNHKLTPTKSISTAENEQLTKSVPTKSTKATKIPTPTRKQDANSPRDKERRTPTRTSLRDTRSCTPTRSPRNSIEKPSPDRHIGCGPRDSSPKFTSLRRDSPLASPVRQCASPKQQTRITKEAKRSPKSPPIKQTTKPAVPNGDHSSALKEDSTLLGVENTNYALKDESNKSITKQNGIGAGETPSSSSDGGETVVGDESTPKESGTIEINTNQENITNLVPDDVSSTSPHDEIIPVEAKVDTVVDETEKACDESSGDVKLIPAEESSENKNNLSPDTDQVTSVVKDEGKETEGSAIRDDTRSGVESTADVPQNTETSPKLPTDDEKDKDSIKHVEEIADEIPVGNENTTSEVIPDSSIEDNSESATNVSQIPEAADTDLNKQEKSIDDKSDIQVDDLSEKSFNEITVVESKIEQSEKIEDLTDCSPETTSEPCEKLLDESSHDIQSEIIKNQDTGKEGESVEDVKCSALDAEKLCLAVNQTFEKMGIPSNKTKHDELEQITTTEESFTSLNESTCSTNGKLDETVVDNESFCKETDPVENVSVKGAAMSDEPMVISSECKSVSMVESDSGNADNEDAEKSFVHLNISESANLEESCGSPLKDGTVRMSPKRKSTERDSANSETPSPPKKKLLDDSSDDKLNKTNEDTDFCLAVNEDDICSSAMENSVNGEADIAISGGNRGVDEDSSDSSKDLTRTDSSNHHISKDIAVIDESDGDQTPTRSLETKIQEDEVVSIAEDESVDSGNASDDEEKNKRTSLKSSLRAKVPTIEEEIDDISEGLHDHDDSLPSMLKNALSPEAPTRRLMAVIKSEVVTENIGGSTITEDSSDLAESLDKSVYGEPLPEFEDDVASHGSSKNDDEEEVRGSDFIDDEAEEGEETEVEEEEDDFINDNSEDSESDSSDVEVLDVSCFILDEAKEQTKSRKIEPKKKSEVDQTPCAAEIKESQNEQSEVITDGQKTVDSIVAKKPSSVRGMKNDKMKVVVTQDVPKQQKSNAFASSSASNFVTSSKKVDQGRDSTDAKNPTPSTQPRFASSTAVGFVEKPILSNTQPKDSKVLQKKVDEKKSKGITTVAAKGITSKQENSNRSGTLKAKPANPIEQKNKKRPIGSNETHSNSMNTLKKHKTDDTEHSLAKSDSQKKPQGFQVTMCQIPKTAQLSELKKTLVDGGIADGLLSINFVGSDKIGKFKTAVAQYKTEKCVQKVLSHYGKISILGQILYFLVNDDVPNVSPKNQTGPSPNKKLKSKTKFVGIINNLPIGTNIGDVVVAFNSRGISSIISAKLYKSKSSESDLPHVKLCFASKRALLEACVAIDSMKIKGQKIQLKIQEKLRSSSKANVVS